MHINFGKHYGGTEIVIKTILENSSDILDNYIVLREESKFEKLLKKSHIVNEITIIPLNMSKYKVISSYKRLISFVVKENIDIVHVHGIFAHLIGILFKKKLKGKIKLITTIHSIISHDRDLIKNLIFTYIENYCLKKTDKVIAISNYVYGNLLKRGVDSSKVVVIYNGINISNDAMAISIKTKTQQQTTFTLGSFGRLEKIKGHEYLIRAVGTLKDTIPHIKCLIIGEGDQRSYLEKLIVELKLSNHVELLGFKANIFPILKKVDVVVLPSLMEGLSLSLIESLLYNKPVIASNIGGIPEVVAHMENGILIPPKDVFSLEQAIQKLYSEIDLRNELSKKGLEVAREKFNSKTMIKKLQLLYD